MAHDGLYRLKLTEYVMRRCQLELQEAKEDWKYKRDQAHRDLAVANRDLKWWSVNPARAMRAVKEAERELQRITLTTPQGVRNAQIALDGAVLAYERETYIARGPAGWIQWEWKQRQRRKKGRS